MAIAKSPQRACRLIRAFLNKASDSDPSFTRAAWNNAPAVADDSLAHALNGKRDAACERRSGSWCST